jgi:hypothetical protein
LDITINLNGIQEGKRYTLEFSVNGEGTNYSTISNPVKYNSKRRDDDMPSLEDIEYNNQEDFKLPEIETYKKTKKDFKIERSWDENSGL